jgi:hypothetical protein
MGSVKAIVRQPGIKVGKRVSVREFFANIETGNLVMPRRDRSAKGAAVVVAWVCPALAIVSGPGEELVFARRTRISKAQIVTDLCEIGYEDKPAQKLGEEIWAALGSKLFQPGSTPGGPRGWPRAWSGYVAHLMRKIPSRDVEREPDGRQVGGLMKWSAPRLLGEPVLPGDPETALEIF